MQVVYLISPMNVTAASYCKFVLHFFDTKFLYSQNNTSRTNHSCHEAKQYLNFANLAATNLNTKSNNNFLIGSSQCVKTTDTFGIRGI
jgi:hypothetical protein